MLASIKGYKSSFYLAKQLAKRDIKAQYRQSFLGIFWALVPVFMSAFVWILLEMSGTIKLSPTNIPYPLFVLVGTTVWSILGECLLMPITTVNGNIAIITKINFDKEALITLGFLKMFFNLLIKLGLIVLFLLYFQVPLSFSIFYFFPMLFLTMLLFISIGVLITPIGVLYGDISRMIPIGLQFLMYVTPVLYITPKVGMLKTIITINPLTYFIIDLRNSLTGMSIENGYFWVGAFFVTVLSSVLAMIVYRISMPIITERMSS